MTFDVHVSDDFMIDGVAIYVSIKHTHGRQILQLGEDGRQTWTDHEPLGVVAQPTLKLPGEAARALLDALLRHYQGAADTQTLRSDLLHERNRVDKITSGLLQIAIHSTGSAFGTGNAP